MGERQTFGESAREFRDAWESFVGEFLKVCEPVLLPVIRGLDRIAKRLGL